MSYILATIDNFEACLKAISSASVLTIDTETTGLKPYSGSLPFMMQIKPDNHDVIIFSLFDSYQRQGIELDSFDNFMELNSLILCLNRFFRDKSKRLVGHNIKFDLHHLFMYVLTYTNNSEFLHYGNLECEIFDTMVLVKYVDNLIPRVSLSFCAKHFNLYEQKSDIVLEYIKEHKSVCMKEVTDVATGEVYFDKCYDRVPFALMAEYGTIDVDTTYSLYLTLARLFNEKYQSIDDTCLAGNYIDAIRTEMEYTRTCFFMEKRGMYVDQKHLNKCILHYENELEVALSAFVSETGKEFNDHHEFLGNIFLERGFDLRVELNEESKNKQRESYQNKIEKQKQKIEDRKETIRKLEEKLSIDFFTYTIGTNKIYDKTVEKLKNDKHELASMVETSKDLSFKRSFSCTENALSKIDDPLTKNICTIRSIRKILSTYLYNILRTVDSYGYVHCDILQTAADTLRSSVKSPAMQTLPREGGQFSIRGCFCAPEGFMLSSTDFAAQELRVALDLGGENEYINAILYGESKEERDPHHKNALLCRTTRDLAKGMFFGKIYGEGYKGLGLRHGIDLKEAQRIYYALESSVPRLTRKVKEWSNTVQRTGSIFTAYGVELKVSNYQIFYYKAGNYKIQGSCQTMTKKAINSWQRVAENVGDGFPVLPVHDETLAIFKERGEYYFNGNPNSNEWCKKFLDCFRSSYIPINGMTMDCSIKFMKEWSK